MEEVKISYTHKGKSSTEFVKEDMVEDVSQQLKNFREFKKLTEEWVDLCVKIAKRRKKELGKKPRRSKS